MDRRSFISGLLAASAAPAVPAPVAVMLDKAVEPLASKAYSAWSGHTSIWHVTLGEGMVHLRDVPDEEFYL